MASDVSDGDRVIVVGVDGSAPSKAALRWAASQALLTNSAIHAVIAWEYPVLYRWEPVAETGDFARVAGNVLAETVKEVLGPAPAVEVRESVEPGHAARVLVDAARHAQLLVVGSRGHGGFTGALLGSVSQHCAHHACCPVVIFRGIEE